MRDKSTDRSGRMEYGDLRDSQIDKLVYEIRRLICSGGPSVAFSQEVVNALRSDELRLPILPDSVSRVMQLVNRSEVDMGELARLVEMDPALAVKTVGVANSAYYRGIEPATSVHGALMRMGLQHAQHVVLAVALRSSLFRVPGYETEAQAVCLHSLYTALATQAILSEVPPWQDTGFLLGLAHDIGRIALLRFAAQLRSRARKHPGPSPAIVEEVSDCVHAGLGALAVESWHFAGDFSQAIAHHHDPDSIKDHRIVLARALAAGDAIAHRIEDGKNDLENVADGVLIELFDSIGIDSAQAASLILEVQDGFGAFGKTL